MSKKTLIDTKFWSDNYICDLDPIEKLVFIYALTNNRISLCGIYEVPIKVMAMETGIDREMLPKILQRLEKAKKIVFRDGWLCIVKYPKHQSYNKTTMSVAVGREIDQIPKDLLDIFIGYGYPIDTLSIGYKEQDKEQVKVKDKERGTKNKPTYPKEFEDFWTEYPRKVAKTTAYRAWQKLNPPVEEVIAGLRAYKDSDQWTRDNGRYIPHPATWLNQKRWEDEVEDTKPEVIILD